jgi:hypothetical protein
MIDPDAKVGLFTRIWDWLTYRPWTDEQLRERVAKSVANTSYQPNWGRPINGPPVAGGLTHRFTFLTDEEITEQKAKETRQ